MTKHERIPTGSDKGRAFGRQLTAARSPAANTPAASTTVVLAAVLLAALIFVGGCGRMGDLIPPDAALLAPPGTPALIGSGQSLILSWEPPYNTAAGKRAPAPTGYLVERSVWSAGREACDECSEATTIVAELDAEKLRLEGKAAERWTDTDLSPGVTYGYRVYPLDQRKRIGNPSESSKLTWQTIPPPQVSATSGDGSAQLIYSPPDTHSVTTAARGLAVYDEEGKLVLQLPFSPGGDERHTGVVTGLENDRSYRFACRWVVTTAQGWQLQSAPVYFTVTPTDTTSPEPPRDLVAFGDRETIALNWFAPRGERYAVLVIERMAVGPDENEPTQWQVVARVEGTRLSYKDASTEPGVKYRYRIISEDSAGNVSAPSPETVGRRLKNR